MKIKQTYRGLTKRTKQLLQNGETEYVDFKKNVKSVKTDDLVAFANSEHGGTLLIGVDEANDNNVQTGQIVGCDVGDSSKLIIMSKALGATPPISLSLFIENINKSPIFRIEIPSGDQKPYCSEGGTYKIRKDGRNHALKPEELLNIFLVKEASKFHERFKLATDQVVKSIKEVSDTIDWMESTISSRVEEMSSTLGLAGYETTDAKNTIDYVEQYVKKIDKDIAKTYKRIYAIIKHHEINDPVRKDYMKEVANQILPELQKDEKLLSRARKGELKFTLNDGEFKLSQEEMDRIVVGCVSFIDEQMDEEE